MGIKSTPSTMGLSEIGFKKLGGRGERRVRKCLNLCHLDFILTSAVTGEIFLGNIREIVDFLFVNGRI